MDGPHRPSSDDDTEPPYAHVLHTRQLPTLIQHNNGRPGNKSHIVHGMDVSHLSQEDMSPPGPSGVVGAYSYHPSSIPLPYRSSHYPPYYPVLSPPQPFLPGNPFDYHRPRGHYRSMKYPPTCSILPYPDPQHYMRHHHHHQQQHGYPPMMYPPPPLHALAQQQQQQGRSILQICSLRRSKAVEDQKRVRFLSSSIICQFSFADIFFDW